MEYEVTIKRIEPGENNKYPTTVDIFSQRLDTLPMPHLKKIIQAVNTPED